MRFAYLLSIVFLAGACGGGDAEPPAGEGGGVAEGGGGAGGGPSCAPDFSGETLRFAVASDLEPGEDETLCLRWTTDEALDITGFVGDLGATGHHSLLLVHETPSEPDGLAPCYEPELMDVTSQGEFAMLAGVSYESSGVAYTFPKSPVQVGLHVPAGSQLIFDAHNLNASGETRASCSTLELMRGAPVVAKLRFRTLLPEAQYGLSIPAMSSKDVSYELPVGEHVRLAAASSHMHPGGTHFRLSVKETGFVIFEADSWADPEPKIFDSQKVVLEEDQTYLLECSFDNVGSHTVTFPDQMCVGGLYVLPCSLPGAC